MKKIYVCCDCGKSSKYDLNKCPNCGCECLTEEEKQ